jgi:hypothetical protein
MKRTERKDRRVNFDFPADEYEEFKQNVESRGGDVSKTIRALMRAFNARVRKDRFADSIVEEVADGVFGEPRMPEEPQDPHADDESSVA